MICPTGVWFHLDCMDMEDEEIPEGDWFCSDNCKKQKRLKKDNITKKEASCRIYIYRSQEKLYS
jgi:predicted nucleic acid-binding Zn ribbon protein